VTNPPFPWNSWEEYNDAIASLRGSMQTLSSVGKRAGKKAEDTLADSAHAGLGMLGLDLPEEALRAIKLAHRVIGFLPLVLPFLPDEALSDDTKEAITEGTEVFNALARGFGVK
jgi:hypothetical protein